MDKITDSLHLYLKKSRVRFNTIFNNDRRTRLEELTSTVFHITRNIDRQKMTAIIDISPKDYTIYLTFYPFVNFSNEKMMEIKKFLNKWNRIGMFSSLTIEEEKGVIEPERYCFNLTSKILSENVGLSCQLWERYLNLLIKESLEAWHRFDIILGSPLYETIKSRGNDYVEETNFKEYRFN